MMEVTMFEYPTWYEWLEAKNRALVTIGKTSDTQPSDEWKHDILLARHSPIRYLHFSFLIECPTWVATHLVRHHEGCQPYVRSQRNDRQSEYDRNEARQDAPVTLIWDLNAEALMNVANKRLCKQASEETREVVERMCYLVQEKCPEFNGLLVPMCEYRHGHCPEMRGCGKYPHD